MPEGRCEGLTQPLPYITTMADFVDSIQVLAYDKPVRINFPESLVNSSFDDFVHAHNQTFQCNINDPTR